MTQDKNRLRLSVTLKPDILELVEDRDWMGIREALSPWPPPEIADLLTDLDKKSRVLLFRALAKKPSAVVFSYLSTEDQNALLKELTDEETRNLMELMSPDDRTHLLEELPGTVTQRLINNLPPEELQEARALLGYPEESVGRLMTPDYLSIRPEWTVKESLNHVRAHGKDMETLNAIYITNTEEVLLGRVLLRQLVLAEPEQLVSDLMNTAPASLRATDDREVAVAAFDRYDVFVLPVVDEDHVLLGIVTVDDILDVAKSETTEDFHKTASIGPISISLRDAPATLLYRRRIIWLMALIVVNIFAGAGIAYFEETIAATVALVFFLPLLIDSAGNAGSQAATLIVRALATGDVQIRDWLFMLGKELGVSVLLGATMALGVSVLGVVRGGMDVAVVVSMTMVLVVIVGSLIGLSMPFLLSKLKLDPATASAPLITSIADISGVMIYFSLATWYLGAG